MVRHRTWRFLCDWASLLLRHPRWLLFQAEQQAKVIRALGTAHFKYHLKTIHHEKLDERLRRLPVEIGVCEVDNYSKAMIVARFCKLLHPRKVLEIGTYRGGMTYHIARNTPQDCQIWTLDLPPKYLNGLSNKMIDSDVALASMERSRVGEEWRGTAEVNKINQLLGDSITFNFSELPTMDLILIDGSHAEPWVEKDTENAFKMVSPTGVILWDDCYWSDVQRVLGRYAQSRPIWIFENGHTAGYLQINGKPVYCRT